MINPQNVLWQPSTEFRWSHRLVSQLLVWNGFLHLTFNTNKCFLTVMSCRVRNTYSLLASTSCSKQFLKGCVRHETDYRARPLKMSFLQVVLESVATVSLHALVDMTMHGQLNIYWKKITGNVNQFEKLPKPFLFWICCN